MGIRRVRRRPERVDTAALRHTDGAFGLARLLVEWRADLRAADRSGCTPVHLATGAREEQLTRLLVEKGADVSAASWMRWAPLHCAAEGGHAAAARYWSRASRTSRSLTERAAPHSTEPPREDMRMWRLLVDGYADVAAEDSGGWTPLLLASHLVRA